MLASQAGNVAANVESAESLEDRESLEAAGGFEIEDLDLPIGWSPDNQTQQTLYRLGIKDSKESKYEFQDPETGEPQLQNLENFTHVQRGWGWVKQCFGWIISGVAISMGAPFWFELLSKVVDIKNTGAVGGSKSDDSKKAA